MSEHETSQIPVSTHEGEPPPSTNGHAESETAVWEEKQKPVHVKIRGADGAVRTYEIREMDEEGLARYNDARQARAKVNRRGVVVRMNNRGFLLDLLVECVWGPDGKRVSRHVIEGWGQKLKSHLYEQASYLNGLAVSAEEVEGKD